MQSCVGCLLHGTKHFPTNGTKGRALFKKVSLRTPSWSPHWYSDLYGPANSSIVSFSVSRREQMDKLNLFCSASGSYCIRDKYPPFCPTQAGGFGDPRCCLKAPDYIPPSTTPMNDVDNKRNKLIH